MKKEAGEYRVKVHPVLDVPEKRRITFMFDGKMLEAYEGEVISSALFAHGIHIFNWHHSDGSPQGIFCANGQCAQCLVLADGVPVKSCVTELKEGMRIDAIRGLPALPEDDAVVVPEASPCVDVDVLIVGGGPAGLSAALELGSMGVSTIIADDKLEMGGKLSLQTHNFFGSINDCYAGDRGMDIGIHLAEEVKKHASVEVWLNSPVVGVFCDKKIGIVKEGVYTLVEPKILLIAAGAREKALAFPGCDLPGVYGAGAFQTLVNRDLILASKRLFILGGGNVGLIGAYHALQAGITVAGIAEALPQCGGYKVHLDKLKRLGIPIFTSHTVVEVVGKEKVEKVIISGIDKSFLPVPGTEKEFDVDTLLIAVGLSPVNELAQRALEYGIKTYSAGDSDVIAEASAAMFSGKITGRQMLADMGYKVEVPPSWYDMLDILRGKPGPIHELDVEARETGTYPIIRCTQEIPCNPCSDACPLRSIAMPGGDITDIPVFDGDCLGCARCVSICPGLSITLVDKDYDKTREKAMVIVPWELPAWILKPGMTVETTGFTGERIGKGRILAMKKAGWQNQRDLVSLEVPMGEADTIAGIALPENLESHDVVDYAPIPDDDIIVCRCERVTKGSIRAEIRRGTRDINALKAALRVGMGPCNGKTCLPLINRIFAEEGISQKDVEQHVERPFTQEVPLSTFLKGAGEKEAKQ